MVAFRAASSNADIAALTEVKAKGEAGGYNAIQSLIEGAKTAQESPDFPTQAELQHTHLSARYAQQYKELTRFGKTPVEAQGILLERVGKKRDQMLRDSVQRAIDAAKQRASNEAQRKKNR